MIARIAATLVVAFIVFLAGGLLLPKTVEVERSIEIGRPVATVFTLVDGFASWHEWSPWLERDPELLVAFGGPGSGAGARLEWRGDERQVGAGLQEVVASVPYRRVDIRLQMDQLGDASMRFDVERIAGGTRLSWRYESALAQGQGALGSIFARYFGLFYGPWVGRDLERGLERIRRLAETLPPADFAGLRVERVEVPGTAIVSLTVFEGPAGRPDDAALASAYRELAAFLRTQGEVEPGRPLAITRPSAAGWRLDAAFPVDLQDLEAAPPIAVGQLPVGPAVRVAYRPRDGALADAYARIAAWIAAQGLQATGTSWEHYLSDPGETPADERGTQVYVQLER